MQVLPASALVPAANCKAPATHFTHAAGAGQVYFHQRSRQGAQPDGHFAPGTPLLLQVRGRGPLCRVVDGRGLSVFTPVDTLRSLPPD